MKPDTFRGDLDVSTPCDAWEAFGLAALCEAVLAPTLSFLGLKGPFELSVMGCDDAEIADLNAQFRGKPTPTNVLSWPAQERAPAKTGDIPPAPVSGPDGVVELGDIALSWTTCCAEASAAGLSLHDHATHLLVHGLLHLLGYDHETDADAGLMERREIEILSEFGIADPYGPAAQ